MMTAIVRLCRKFTQLLIKALEKIVYMGLLPFLWHEVHPSSHLELRSPNSKQDLRFSCCHHCNLHKCSKMPNCPYIQGWYWYCWFHCPSSRKWCWSCFLVIVETRQLIARQRCYLRPTNQGLFTAGTHADQWPFAQCQVVTDYTASV